MLLLYGYSYFAILAADFVEDLIPQKFPFVMIDKMFSYSNETLTSGLKVTKNNIFVLSYSGKKLKTISFIIFL